MSNSTVDRSLLDRAKHGDNKAIETMFRQFVGADEEIWMVEYLGVKGILGLGSHSFACLTNRRVADLDIGFAGRVVYQDAYLEHINSAVFYQASLLPLYLLIAVLVVGAYFSFGLSLLLIPFTGKLYYRLHKSGIVLWVREGIPVYLFTNRTRLSQATRMWRACAELRDQRILGAGRQYTSNLIEA